MIAPRNSRAAPAKRESTRTPGSSSSCAATNSFATRSIPSRNGVTTPCARTIKPCKRGACDRAVDVADRRPVDIAELPLTRPATSATSRLISAYSGNLLARRRRDLQRVEPMPVIGIEFEKTPESLDTLRDALRVVEPVDAQRQHLSFERFFEPSRVGESGSLREPDELFGIDRDRKHADLDRPARRLRSSAGIGLDAHLLAQIGQEIVEELLRSESRPDRSRRDWPQAAHGWAGSPAAQAPATECAGRNRCGSSRRARAIPRRAG